MLVGSHVSMRQHATANVSIRQRMLVTRTCAAVVLVAPHPHRRVERIALEEVNFDWAEDAVDGDVLVDVE